MTRLKATTDRSTDEVMSELAELVEAGIEVRALRREVALLLDRVDTSQAECKSLRTQLHEARAQSGDLGHKLGLVHAAVGDVEAGLADAPAGPYRSGARSVLAEIRAVLDS